MNDPQSFTNKYVVEITDPDDKLHPLTFNLTRRLGCSTEMRAETVSHYIHMLKRALNGFADVADEKYLGRTLYETPMIGRYDTSQYDRIKIWGKVKVFDGYGYRFFEANTFTEYTSAQDMLDEIWQEVQDADTLREFGIKPVGCSEFINNGSQNGIGRDLPPVEDIQDTDDIEAPEMPENDDEDDFSHISLPGGGEIHARKGGHTKLRYEFLGDATKEAKAVARERYIGQMVGFTVRRIQHDDGKSFRCFSGYHGKASQYPINSKGQDMDYIDDGQTLTLLDELPYDENGYADCNLIGVFRIKAAERGAYYNLVRLRESR